MNKKEEGELINKIFDGDKCKRLMDGIKKIEDSQLKIGSWNYSYHQLSLAWNLSALEVWYEMNMIDYNVEKESCVRSD